MKILRNIHAETRKFVSYKKIAYEHCTTGDPVSWRMDAKGHHNKMCGGKLSRTQKTI